MVAQEGKITIEKNYSIFYSKFGGDSIDFILKYWIELLFIFLCTGTLHIFKQYKISIYYLPRPKIENKMIFITIVIINNEYIYY